MTRTPDTPFDLFARSLEVSCDIARQNQAAMIDTLERFAAAQPDRLNWVKIEIPVSNPDSLFDVSRTRDAFHRLADANLRAWGFAAETLNALPAWSHWPTSVPGTVLTDWFDQMRRASHMEKPANDIWETPPAGRETPAANDAPTARPAGPILLDTPDGEPDDLTSIKGIGEKLLSELNRLGIYHFSQIAAWSEADGVWIDEKLAFKGRVARQNWVEQARKLAAGAAA